MHTVWNASVLLSLLLAPLASSRQTVGTEAQQIALHEYYPVSLPHKNPTKSFWTHGSPDANPLAKEGSQGNLTLDADTVIIGSGITGIGAAYHLSQLVKATGLSHDIVILEARDFCTGATGRNGGHLVPTAFHGFRTASETYNVDEAVRSLLLENHTTESIVSILSGHEAEVDLVKGGHATLFFSDEEEFEWKSDWHVAIDAGIDPKGMKFMSKYETQKNYGPAFSSVITPGYNLWPLKAVTHFFRLAQKAILASKGTSKIHLHTHTPALSVRRLSAINTARTRRRWVVETPRGNVSAYNVIHATNGYAAYLLPFLAGPGGIVPTRGQVCSTRAGVGTDKIAKLGFGANEGHEYWFPRPLDASHGANRPLVILGGGREAAKPNHELGVTDDSVINPVISDRLKHFLPEIYPNGWFERDKEPEMEWTGIMGYTRSTDPFVGPVVIPPRGETLEGQYIAAGYTGHGMPRAFGCAEVLAQMIFSSLKNESWNAPEWFPEHVLTTSKWRLQT